MRSQTIATELIDQRDWHAAPVDPAGWLTGRPAGSSGHRPAAAGDGQTSVKGVPSKERRDDRASAGLTERRAARARRLRKARARAQRASIAKVDLQAVRPTEEPSVAPVVAERIESRPEGYRLGRWTRLALTLTVLAAAVVVTVSLVGGSAPVSLVDVTVGPGDTLWSIAQKASPDRDPRAVIDEIRQLNDVPTDTLPIGIVLRVPAASD